MPMHTYSAVPYGVSVEKVTESREHHLDLKRADDGEGMCPPRADLVTIAAQPVRAEKALGKRGPVESPHQLLIYLPAKPGAHLGLYQAGG